MQDELDAAGLDVVIFGVNGVGHESGNANVTLGRDLGWLQETAEEPVWDRLGDHLPRRRHPRREQRGGRDL
jgi:hypothetical protein